MKYFWYYLTIIISAGIFCFCCSDGHAKQPFLHTSINAGIAGLSGATFILCAFIGFASLIADIEVE